MSAESRKKKILVIEDDVYVHELLTYLLLQNNSYEVITIDDGLKALDMIEKETPDLVFVDYMLPKVDGLEICRRLRKDEKTSSIPIILMSASAKLKELKDVQVDYFMSKPFNMSDILNQVEKLLNR